MARAEPLRIDVVYCPRPGVTELVPLRLEAGSSVADALQGSGLLERHGLALDALKVGVWCRAKDPLTPLRDLDRVEVYRPLQVDPKEARRLRYRRHKDRLAASGTRS
jgi:putative ubiquitin-RnfH superfamily antitoxin RatB of RatAB toxin-antitoxin module